MPSFSSLEYILSRKQGPKTNYLYEFHTEPERCQKELQDRGIGNGF